MSTHPLVIAHRGASADAPENTLASFKLAWQVNADGAEGDYHLTRDGRLVCVHDATLLRTGGVDLAVADVTLEELLRHEVGSWHGRAHAAERVPTVEEVFAITPPGKRLYIEIKDDPSAVEYVARTLAGESKAGSPTKGARIATTDVSILSFHPGVIQAARTILPNCGALLCVDFRRELGKSEWRPTSQELIAGLESCRATGVDIEARISAVTESLAQGVRRAGFELHAWTVNDAPTARHLARLGFDSLTTDHPAWLKRLLAS